MIKSYIGVKPNAEHPIRVGRNVSLTSFTRVGKYTVLAEGSMVGINTESIGRYCSVGAHSIIGANNHPTDRLSTSACFYSPVWKLVKTDLRERFNETKKTIIEHDVWIGAKSVVLGGVRIRTGAIVGAGAVVTKDVSPYAIVAGVPARIIGYRFPKEIIDLLLASEWWRKDPRALSESWNCDNIGDVLKSITRLPLNRHE
ncbi:MAG: CatB-related O-acetyltransferase [bacterium]